MIDSAPNPPLYPDEERRAAWKFLWSIGVRGASNLDEASAGAVALARSFDGVGN